eukprot:TRINITY_DN41650_c0_g1_i1.p1 TRINITY_DN41650_c0_g1~~TRINITY_DN41650_c0_g1_i1.p1  ORF type:complete len:294 (+),score=52.23 TRINITY_DN41650_c0_g1_i1:64-945(+)
MLGALDLSFLASALMAVAWIRGISREAAGGGESQKKLDQIGWMLIMGIRSYYQALPFIFVMLAASSPLAVIYSACSFALPLDDEEGWLGSDPDIGFWRRLCLLAALAIWRAEKLESLLQRLQRSAGIIQAKGFGPCVKSAIADPYGWIWPPFWGIFRRFALIVISTTGYAPFVRAVLPATVFDEFLWYAMSQTQDLCARKLKTSTPVVVDVLVLPILDLLHFLPVLSKVALIAVLEYPLYDAPGSYPLVLACCALAWTAHNCHQLYTTVWHDLPESARQMWEARSGGSGGEGE